MANKTAAELAIDIVTDASRAVAGFGDVETSAAQMSSAVEDAGRTAERTGRQIGISADAADELGGKAGKATGALGALSSGFELVGAEKYAGALQGASMATDFFSGIGDSLNLVMESTIAKTAIAKVQMLGHAVATTAASTASKAAAAGQWLLNAAMSANPIGIVVIATVALVAGFVLLYKRSADFREIVGDVGRVGKQAFELITLPTRTLLDVVVNVAGKIREALPGALSTAKTAFSRVGNALSAPFDAVKSAIAWILDAIDRIKIPKLPGFLGGGGRVAGPAPAAVSYLPTPVTVQGGATYTYNYTFNLNGLLSDDEAADLIAELLDRRARQYGLVA